jgi:hypothetical protein
MALRSQTRIGIVIAAFTVTASATELTVGHAHLRRNRPGVLTVDADGIRYVESVKKKPHTFRWAWDSIQKVALSSERIEITGYRDRKWLAGMDERETFSGTGLEVLYSTLRQHLPRRLVPELARTDFEVQASFPAKKQDGFGGSEGVLLLGRDRLVFRSDARRGSHTWILEEVDNISSSDPLQLTVSSLGAEYRLQLKKPLPETVYNELWRRLNVRRAQ